MNYKEKVIAILNSTELSKEQKEKLENIFPELARSEDERIKLEILELVTIAGNVNQFDEIKDWLEKRVEPEDKGEISDGYHTFNELYRYRMLYNAAFFNLLPKELVHKSKKHHDGKECFGGGWFIVIANLPTGQISNHYELKDWDLFKIPEKEVADEFDGHTPQDAADRLNKYLLETELELQGKSVLKTWKDMRLEVYQQASGNRHEPNCSDDSTKMFSLNDIDEIIEKISEQKTIDKIESKFKVGDWVVSNNYGEVWQVYARYTEEGQRIYLCNVDEEIMLITLDELNNDYRLWTVNNAKSGDVIVSGKTIVLIREKHNKSFDSICAYIGEDNDFIPHVQYNWKCDNTWYPATKEQSELLFNKMKEAGYKLNNNIKKLKKVNYKK